MSKVWETDGYNHCMEIQKKIKILLLLHLLRTSGRGWWSGQIGRQGAEVLQQYGKGGEIMREILFRGKRIDNGEWETGFFVTERLGCSDAKYFITDKMTGYHTPVDPATVGQYTGLIDKNGVKIFEGDIVRDDIQNKIGYVIFLQQEAGYVVVYKHYDRRLLGHRNRGSFHDCDINLEVIGNIHDSPELLEGGKSGK